MVASCHSTEKRRGPATCVAATDKRVFHARPNETATPTYSNRYRISTYARCTVHPSAAAAEGGRAAALGQQRGHVPVTRIMIVLTCGWLSSAASSPTCALVIRGSKISLLLPQVEAERRRSGSSRGTRGEESGDSGGARLSARNLERLKAAAAAEDVRLERRSDTKGACLGARSRT